MRKWIAALSGLALAGSAVGQEIPAIAEIKLEPAGKWTVEYGDWKCLLRRDFATAGQRAVFSLSLEPLSNVAWTRISVEGPGGKRDDGDDAVMVIDGVRNPNVFHYNIYKADRSRMREYMVDLAKHRIGTTQQTIRFWTKKHGDIEIAASGFPAAWKSLNQCMADLYADLGIVAADVAQMAVPPEGHLSDFVETPRPEPVLDFGVFYWVTAEGGVDDCRLLLPSGVAKFDKSLCSQLKDKARFKPGRNAAGQAIRVPRFDHFTIRTIRIHTSVPIRPR